MRDVQHQATTFGGGIWPLEPVSPAGLPAVSGQDETLGSKGLQVKSAGPGSSDIGHDVVGPDLLRAVRPALNGPAERQRTPSGIRLRRGRITPTVPTAPL
jgi:hypothetical protein